MTLQQHFSHLAGLLAAPFTANWAAYVKHRMLEIAAEDPTCAELPAMVHAEFQRLKANSVQQQSSTSNEKPSEPHGTDAPVPKPAATPTTRRPGSTGQRPMSLLEG